MTYFTEYSDVFSLRDEIGLAPNMHVELEMLDKKPFFIRPFSVKENIKPKIDKEMEKLTVLGILKKGLSGYSSPAMPIPRKNSDIPRIASRFSLSEYQTFTTQHEFSIGQGMYSTDWCISM